MHNASSRVHNNIYYYTLRLRVFAVKVVNSARATSRNTWEVNVVIEWLPYSNKFGHKSEMKVMLKKSVRSIF